MLSLWGSGKSCSILIQFNPSTEPALLLSFLSLSLVLFATSLLGWALGAHLHPRGRNCWASRRAFLLLSVVPRGSALWRTTRPGVCPSKWKASPWLCIASLTTSLHLSTWHCPTPPATPPPAATPLWLRSLQAAPAPGFLLPGWQPLEWSVHSSPQHFPQVPLDRIVSASAQHFSGWLSTPHTTRSQPLGQTSECQSHIALRAS